MLQIIADVREGASEPVIPVRWCLSPSLLNFLKETGAVNPHILFSVQNEQEQETERQLVPLEQAMSFVSFRNPGMNKLNAAIVWGHDVRKLRKIALAKKSSSRYAKTIYEYDGTEKFRPDYLDDTGVGEVLCRCLRTANNTASINIRIDQQFFAGEPSRFEKWWVNLWFEYEPRDQCEFRRRRLIAYTIQPPLVLLAVLWLSGWRILYASFLLLMGIRGAKLSTILHPFRNNFQETWGGNSIGSYDPRSQLFSRESDFFGSNAEGEKRLLMFGLLRPAYWALALLVIWVTSLFDISTMLNVASVLLILSAVSLLILVILGILGVWAVLEDRFAPGIKTRRRERFEQARLKQLEELRRSDNRYKDIVCNAEPKPVTIGSLSRPTLTLRFQALKARVCRPYTA